MLSSINFLKKDTVTVPEYYYSGKRKIQILHTRLRTNCSSLNLDLFIWNISDYPMCACGSVEDTQHYLFHCSNFRQQRNYLTNEISRYCNPSLNLILYGDLTLSFEITFSYPKLCKSIFATHNASRLNDWPLRFNNVNGSKMRATVACAPAPITL